LERITYLTFFRESSFAEVSIAEVKINTFEVEKIRHWLPSDLPQTRHSAHRGKSENGGILRLTAEPIFEAKSGPEGPFLSIVFRQVIDLKMVGMTGFEPATPCTP